MRTSPLITPVASTRGKLAFGWTLRSEPLRRPLNRPTPPPPHLDPLINRSWFAEETFLEQWERMREGRKGKEGRRRQGKRPMVLVAAGVIRIVKLVTSRGSSVLIVPR